MLRALLLSVALGLGCAASLGRPALDADGPGSLLGAADLGDLSIAFYDPQTFQQFSAQGPFRVIAAEGNGIELEGYDPAHARPANVTLFAARGGLWARLRVDEREFLTRLR
jgi:hypothetical protein